jgi:large subunit ribosomal protein L3
MIGLIARKVGMTQMMHDASVYPVTVLLVEPNYYVQKKTFERDGYEAVQIAAVASSKQTKPRVGHFNKYHAPPSMMVREFKLSLDALPDLEQHVNLFKVGDRIDVVSEHSHGKGFSGAVKRWNFKMQPASHGTSLTHRAPGSIGQNQTPGKVFKGKKMPGGDGNRRVTVKNLIIVGIDKARRLLFVKGSVPGSSGGLVMVKIVVKSGGDS